MVVHLTHSTVETQVGKRGLVATHVLSNNIFVSVRFSVAPFALQCVHHREVKKRVTPFTLVGRAPNGVGFSDAFRRRDSCSRSSRGCTYLERGHIRDAAVLRSHTLGTAFVRQPATLVSEPRSWPSTGGSQNTHREEGKRCDVCAIFHD